MSSEEDRVKSVGKREISETSVEESGAKGKGGRGDRKVSEKDIEKGNETQERNTPTSQITGGDNHKKKDLPARKPVKTAQDEDKFSLNPDRKGGEGEQTADESPEKGFDEPRLDPHEGLRQKVINPFHLGIKSQSSYYPLLGIFLAAIVACVAFYLFTPKSDVETESDLESVFRNGLEKLQLSFTNQTDRFWKILESRRLAHLRNKDPSQPLVFLLAAPPAAHEHVDCLALKLAQMLDPRHKKNLTRIDGEKEKANPPNETKMTMDKEIKKGIEADHRVVLICHLELLPPPSQLLFHSYCDDQNAPYKELAFIFTVHMPIEPSPPLSPKEAEGSVEKYLSGDVWEKDDKDAIAALLVRIADTVLLMNGETSDSARAFCS